MTDTQNKELLQEIRDKQHISPFEDDKTIESYITEAKFDINNIAGAEINYSEDFQAKSLLENYVFYARHKRLAEFKERYGGEYVKLQAKYYRNSDIQWRKI